MAAKKKRRRSAKKRTHRKGAKKRHHKKGQTAAQKRGFVKRVRAAKKFSDKWKHVL
jgi:hypothetical protein